MELVTFAEAMTRLGALGLGTAIMNVVALRVVRVDDVPPSNFSVNGIACR